MFLRSVVSRPFLAPPVRRRSTSLRRARRESSANDKIPDATLASPYCKISFGTGFRRDPRSFNGFFQPSNFRYFNRLLNLRLKFCLPLSLSDSFILAPFLFSSRAFFRIFYFRFFRSRPTRRSRLASV